VSAFVAPAPAQSPEDLPGLQAHVLAHRGAEAEGCGGGAMTAFERQMAEANDDSERAGWVVVYLLTLVAIAGVAGVVAWWSV